MQARQARRVDAIRAIERRARSRCRREVTETPLIFVFAKLTNFVNFDDLALRRKLTPLPLAHLASHPLTNPLLNSTIDPDVN